MPPELAAAAIVRGAARSTAVEPWKAAVRPPTHLGVRSSSAHRCHFLTSPSTAPPDATHRRRRICLPERASGREGLEFSCSLVRHCSDPYSRPFLAAAPCSVKKALRHEEGAYPIRPATSIRAAPSSLPGSTKIPNGGPHLGRLVKASLLVLMLHKMGLLPPPPKADKTKAAVNFTLLALALLAGYVAAKQNKKFEFMLKVCDNTMKAYKLFAEIVDLLSTFFK